MRDHIELHTWPQFEPGAPSLDIFVTTIEGARVSPLVWLFCVPEQKISGRATSRKKLIAAFAGSCLSNCQDCYLINLSSYRYLEVKLMALLAKNPL